MSLVSNLRTMGLPDLLQWLATTQKTGTLYLKRRSVEKRLLFRDGLVLSSWSNDPRESLGQFLLRDGLLSEADLFRALLVQETQQGRLYGAILIEEGLITEDQLREALKKKAEESVYDLFLWPDGAFEFKDEDEPDDFSIHFELRVHEVVLEGVRRLDELHRIRELIPSLRTTFRVIRQPRRVESQRELQVLGLLAMGQTVSQVSMETRLSEFETAEVLFRLHHRGMIEVDEPGEDTQPLDTVAAIRDRLALADMRLAARDYGAARRAYQDVLALQPLNQQAKKGLLTVERGREREQQLVRVDRDRVPRIRLSVEELTRQSFAPQEGFVLSRVNGEWTVDSILKVCPLAEEDTLAIFTRLVDRGVIELVDGPVPARRERKESAG